MAKWSKEKIGHINYGNQTIIGNDIKVLINFIRHTK